MQDVLFLLVIAGFFAVAAALVAACDRIVGPDPLTAPSAGPAPEAMQR